MVDAGMFFGGIIFGVLAGIAVGMFLSWSMLERYYTAIMNVEDMLKRFKSEGEDDKWLK
jgi:fructose-specific phosphotransferase system IIC component